MPTTEWERKHRPQPGTTSAATLREAQRVASGRGLRMAADLFRAVADALGETPNPGRWGIPEDVVARDTAEAIRWSPVVAHAVALAQRMVADARLGDGSLAEAWLEGAAT
jgi:hypothetical protein